MRVEEFVDGVAICDDSTSAAVMDEVERRVGLLPLIIADPPYGNIVCESWDKVEDSTRFTQWLIDWTKGWSERLLDGGAFYVWGGLGKPCCRPFLRYLTEIEELGVLEIANVITWSKKRAYGVSHNYLYTREECAYLIKGHAKKPRCFNIPLLETKRAYAGYNEKYPAKSEYYRRSNVWTDINEMFCNKRHPTQKQQRLHEIMIEVHTHPNEWVLDPFAGAGTTALAARKLGRRFIVIEQDVKYFEDMIKLLTL